jgi:hypothetical protein
LLGPLRVAHGFPSPYEIGPLAANLPVSLGKPDPVIAMNERPSAEQVLERILERWIERNMETHATELQRLVAQGMPEWQVRKYDSAKRARIEQQGKECQPYLTCFLEDNSAKSAEDLSELASKLSPGGAHTDGLLVQIVRSYLSWADPILVAATIWHCWHGGKAGFQFLPDPAETDPEEYRDQVEELISALEAATNGDPRRLLTGEDRVFYDSLPDRAIIYRGCNGISPDQAGAGICWTTKRDIAERFALRFAGAGRDPIVMKARINKSEIRLAKASECEVVTMPLQSRPIKCRPYPAGWQPEMHSARYQG